MEQNLTSESSGHDPRQHHILLVDDCQPRCIINRGLFREFPCQVSVAFGGLQALDFLGLARNGAPGHSVDMIVTVFEMSGMNGFQLLRIIKNSPISHVPVIVTVPDEDQTRIAMCLRGGARSCVLEPLRSAFVGPILSQTDGRRGPMSKL